MERKSSYMWGFIPYGVAAGVLSLCGGFTAAVPTNIATQWGMDSVVTWITLAYSLGAAAMAPIMGKIGDAFGRKKSLLLGMGLLTAGELLIAVCPTGSLVPLLFFRFIVGVGAATIAPIVMAYIMTEFPPDKIGFGCAIYMFIGSGMVIFGPTLGGIVNAAYGWRPVLLICVAMCALSVLIVLVMAERDTAERKSLKGFDFPGAVFTLICFSMLLSIPTCGQNYGWGSVPTVSCITVGILSLAALFFVERRTDRPIMNGRFMARKQFILPVIVLFLSQGLLQSCMTNIIKYAYYTSDNGSVLSGIATSVMYLGMAIGTIVVAPISNKKEPRIVAAGALVIVAIGAALQLLFTESAGLMLMCATLFLIGLGLGGNATIFMKVALSGVAPDMAASGSGTYSVFRDISAPFGVAVFVPMFTSAATSLIAEGTVATQAAMESLHSTAIVQTVCVIIGIGVCLMLPKIYADKA